MSPSEEIASRRLCGRPAAGPAVDSAPAAAQSPQGALGGNYRGAAAAADASPPPPQRRVHDDDRNYRRPPSFATFPANSTGSCIKWQFMADKGNGTWYFRDRPRGKTRPLRSAFFMGCFRPKTTRISSGNAVKLVACRSASAAGCRFR